MPELGDIQRGREIGKIGGAKHNYIWSACEDCGEERWVHYIKKHDAPRATKCLSCGSVEQGGRGPGYKSKEGYKYIHLYRKDPLYSMTKTNHSHALEHRIVMARHLGRCLTNIEIVHHLNGIKDDNRVENLTLTTRDQHIHLEEPYKERIAGLEDKLRKTEMAISTPCLN